MADRPTSRPITWQRGLTLVEVMITLTIAAILLTWAVPSLQDFIVRNRMSTEVNNFVASLYVARSEAVKQLRNVRLCPSTDGDSCTTNWHQGWMVYAEVNGNNTFDAGTDQIIQQNSALPSRFQISSGRSVIVFQPNGQSGGSPDTFIFCDTGGVANIRKVVLSNEGRVRTEALSTSVCG